MVMQKNGCILTPMQKLTPNGGEISYNIQNYKHSQENRGGYLYDPGLGKSSLGMKRG